MDASRCQVLANKPSLDEVTAKYVASTHSISSWQTAEDICNQVPVWAVYCPSGFLETLDISLMSNMRGFEVLCSHSFTDIPSLARFHRWRSQSGHRTCWTEPKKIVTKDPPQLPHPLIFEPTVLRHSQALIQMLLDRDLFVSPFRSLIREKGTTPTWGIVYWCTIVHMW